MGYLLEYDETNPISIETYGKRLIGKTFQDICDEDDMRKAAVVRETENYEVKHENKKRKGGLGELVEERYFHYQSNNDARPDFDKAGVELKVTPCWDGNIYIHENAKHTKKNIKRIPTQVKGRAATAKSVKESIKYGVSYDDLNAYMMDGGTIFFVVYIDKEKGEVLQIYYTVLLPIKIKDIFKQKKKTYYVSLKKFPADNKKKIEVVYDAYANAQRQKSFAGTNSPTIEELSKKGVLEGISFHFVHTGEEVVPSMIPKIMEGNSFTIYANVTGNPIGIPVEYCENISQVLTCQQFDRHVTVAGVKYYDKYQNIYSISTVKTVIGNCLTMTYPMIEETEKRKIPVTLEFSINGTLREQIKKIEFVIAIVTKGGFEIGDIDIPVSLNREEFREKLNELTERVLWLKSISYRMVREVRLFSGACIHIREEK